MSTPDSGNGGSKSVPRSAPDPRVPLIDAEADKALDDAFTGLLGTPPERIEQRGFPKDRHQTAIGLAEAMIESGIHTPEGMAEYLDRRFDLKARPFSQSLWSLFAFAEPSLASVPDWDVIYATRDAVERQLNNPETVNGLAREACAGLFTASPGRTESKVISIEGLTLDVPLDEASSEAAERITCNEDDFEDDDQDQDEENEDVDDVCEFDEAVALWANAVRGNIEAMTCLLDVIREREGLNPDHLGAIKAMRSELAKIIHGIVPGNHWELDLKLTQGAEDGSSRGTRTYALSVHSGGFGMTCHGTEWEHGAGSDSWTGASFDYQLRRPQKESGEVFDFMGEFKQAVGDADFVLSISLNDESIGDLPHPRLNDPEGEALAKRTIRELVGKLQRMPDTLSGDDSVLGTTWDEICVQQQFEKSVFWDVYELTMRTLIEGSVGKMPREELVKVWLLTSEGEDWTEEQETEDEEPCPNVGDVVDFLYGRLLSVSADYLNPRIIAYRDRRYRDG